MLCIYHIQGAHLTINARTEDDLDEDDMLDKISKSSGSNYSFHKEAPRPVEAQTGPVVGLHSYVCWEGN